MAKYTVYCEGEGGMLCHQCSGKEEYEVEEDGN